MYGTTKDTEQPVQCGKEKQSWRTHNFRFQVILQSCSHPNKTVRHKNRHSDQRNRIQVQTETHNYVVHESSTKQAMISKGKRTVSTTNGVGKTRQLRTKE